MKRIVMKFGGTSVANPERIAVVGQHVKREFDEGNQVAVVVSAMAGQTDKLVELVNTMPIAVGGKASFYDAREYDTVVSAGEQITSGLLAIALQSMGIDARSWQGWQMPMQTDSAHGSARIGEVKTDEIILRMENRQVPCIAGFQGVSDDNRITTLGRGGTDTSAVAMAIALKADRCDIYTDVDGVYTTDPRIVPNAKCLEQISFEEMLEMAGAGAKVMQVRSVELAMVNNMPILVRSSFDDPNSTTNGTLICNEEEIMEQQNVTGIAISKLEAQISLRRIADEPGIAAAIFNPLAEANINVDMIVQNVSEDDTLTDMTFTLPEADLENALNVLEKAKGEIGFENMQSEKGFVKVAIVGMGMRNHAGVAATAFKALADKKVNIHAITTSEIKISILIKESLGETAVQTLHSIYKLDE